MKHSVALGALLALMFPLAGCDAPAQQAREPAAPLEELAAQGRLVFEPGSEVLAREVARHLLQSVEQAQVFHGLHFKQPVKVHVFATRESFKRHARGGAARAVSFMNGIYVSPKLAKEIETTPAILVHESSHVLLEQHMGGLRYALLPTWFQEGLATLASGGGGAEGVTREEAVVAIRAGRTFKPVASAFVDFPQYASKYGLKPRMFYRQASLFVGYMRARDPERFAVFLSALAKKDFAELIREHFCHDLAVLWREFLGSL